MKPLTPIAYNEKIYDEYAVSLNAGLIPRSGTYTTAINLTFIPMFVDQDGNMHLITEEPLGNAYVKRFSTDDIRNCGNTAALQAFFQINKIVEVFGVSQNFCAMPSQ